MRMAAAKRGVARTVVSAVESVCAVVVGTDDTPVKVLDRTLPHARKGRFWPYVGDREHPAAVYDYTPTRERADRRSSSLHTKAIYKATRYI